MKNKVYKKRQVLLLHSMPLINVLVRVRTSSLGKHWSYPDSVKKTPANQHL